MGIRDEGKIISGAGDEGYEKMRKGILDRTWINAYSGQDNDQSMGWSNVLRYGLM